MWETSTGHSPAARTGPEGAGSQTTHLRLHCLVFFLDIFLFVLVMIMSLKTVSGTVVVFNKCELNTHTGKHTQNTSGSSLTYQEENLETFVGSMFHPGNGLPSSSVLQSRRLQDVLTIGASVQSILIYTAPFPLKSDSWWFTETQREERRGEEFSHEATW